METFRGFGSWEELAEELLFLQTFLNFVWTSSRGKAFMTLEIDAWARLSSAARRRSLGPHSLHIFLPKQFKLELFKFVAFLAGFEEFVPKKEHVAQLGSGTSKEYCFSNK